MEELPDAADEAEPEFDIAETEDDDAVEIDVPEYPLELYEEVG
jgi:hypothetical protein